MGLYLFSSGDESWTRYFYTDGEAVTYGETIGECIVIMRQVYYEDSLATGNYWTTIYTFVPQM